MNRINKLLKFLLLVVAVCKVSILFAKVELPSIFRSNMVLQQKSIVEIWGRANPERSIEIVTSWNQKKYTVISTINGKWKADVETPEAGGPFSISISDGQEVELNNILIGEVWFCSGQSNMEMPMKGYRNQLVLNSNEVIAKSRNESIRFFTVSKDTSSIPLNDFVGKWQECEPENVTTFSATAYFFGKMLNDVLGVPIGLINSSWGGTRIEQWMSSEGIDRFKIIPGPEQKKGDKIASLLYNAMVNPIAGYNMRGVIWYQGENNHREHVNYAKLLPDLVEDWRTKWGIGELAFYYAQIAPFNYNEPGVNSAFFREAQLMASDALPNIGMACLLDIGEEDCIHPANKKAVGERLAYQALVKTYGMKGIAYSGPALEKMEVKGSVVELTFNHAENGLTSFGKTLTLFKLAGNDKNFYPAKAEITTKGIILSSPRVTEPVSVRYAFDDFVVGELYNTEGLPASSFRTDDW